MAGGPFRQGVGTSMRGIGLSLLNICPKCGRRYHISIRNCLECGTRLASLGEETTKKQPRGGVRKIGIVALTAVFLVCIFLFALPLLNTSTAAGPDFSTVSKTLRAPPAPAGPVYTLNQTVRSETMEVTVLSTREGTNVLNSDRFFFVKVNLHNPSPDHHLRISGSDFVLTDGQGQTYFTGGLNDTITQDLPPQGSKSCELEYEIPRDTSGLVLQVYFPRETPGSADQLPALFALP
jgi:hypothetical protein